MVYPTSTGKVVEQFANRFRLVVVTSVEVGWRKPHPTIYSEALNRLGISASDAVFVGDNYVADYLGPKVAGMRVFLLSSSPNEKVPENELLTSLTDLLSRNL